MCRICIAEVWVRSKVSGCGLGRQHRLGAREVERVLHVAGGMVRRHVERFEVVVVVLDLGAFEHLIAEAREDLLHLVADEAERMARSRGPAGGRAA